MLKCLPARIHEKFKMCGFNFYFYIFLEIFNNNLIFLILIYCGVTLKSQHCVSKVLFKKKKIYFIFYLKLKKIVLLDHFYMLMSKIIFKILKKYHFDAFLLKNIFKNNLNHTPKQRLSIHQTHLHICVYGNYYKLKYLKPS